MGAVVNRYRVAFKGEVVAGCPVHEVKAAFAARFRKDADAIERIFSGDVKTLAKDLDFPILADPEKKAAEAYGVVGPGQGFPSRWTFYIGTDGKILAIDKKVDVKTAGADIATKLGELGVAKAK